ncbi:MAG: hypothetical protein J6386_18810 [Candidatus Synoicihabitans palmerolidicus]|nr:hypothetical protein [Candidatus Synoicihabitans palmerolidicus]
MDTLPPPPLHPRLKTLIRTGESIITAAQLAEELIRKARRKRRPYHTVPKRHPGSDTPMWNAVVASLRIELTAHRNKTRLARYLGLPPQRIFDYVRGRRRLPDTETLLLILHWISERHAGRDPSL